MEATLYSYRILLVSSSDFVIGLLKGYCLANSLRLDVRDTLTDSLEKDPVQHYRLIIIDLRTVQTQTGKDDADQFLFYFGLRRFQNVDLCAITDCRSECYHEVLPCFDWIVEEPVMENLERFLGERDKKLPALSLERRRRERRQCQDRRAQRVALHRDSNASLGIGDSSCHDADRFCIGPFSIDRNNKTLHLHDKDLELTAKEFELFELLASDSERAFNTDTIIKTLWPKNHRANKADLYQYIHLLRRKVETDPYNPRWLLTVKGVGYRLHVEKQGAQM